MSRPELGLQPISGSHGISRIARVARITTEWGLRQGLLSSVRRGLGASFRVPAPKMMGPRPGEKNVKRLRFCALLTLLISAAGFLTTF